jgi:CRISPR/Cas system CSM-associated protein Csm3 (group 7 of RAMP superfamily)
MISLDSLTTNQAETLTLTAIVDTALCIGSGGSSGSLSDKPIVRDGSGRLIIPASQLKGRLRHQCERLARGLDWPVCYSPVAQNMCPQRAKLADAEEAKFNREDYIIRNLEDSNQASESPVQDPIVPRYYCLICRIFGNPALTSHVLFSDLICEERELSEVLRSGVTINRARRTAEEKRLYFLETSPVNAGLVFTGEIQISSKAPSQTKPLLVAGLKLIDALGGSKSTGLGWLQWVLGDIAKGLDWSLLLGEPK